VSQLADIDDALFEVRTRAIGRSMGYPKRLLADKIVFNFGRHLRHYTRVPIHVREGKGLENALGC
jgi:hypothetical protein